MVNVDTVQFKDGLQRQIKLVLFPIYWRSERCKVWFHLLGSFLLLKLLEYPSLALLLYFRVLEDRNIRTEAPFSSHLKEKGDEWLTSRVFFLLAFCQKLELNILRTAKKKGSSTVWLKIPFPSQMPVSCDRWWQEMMASPHCFSSYP